MISATSSIECTISCPLMGSNPNSRTTPLPAPFINTMNGRMTFENHSSGWATHRLTASGRCRAMALGASSPKITCRNVIAAKATTVAILCAAIHAPCWGKKPNAGSISRAKVGSPTQPKARLASVMPSCVAAMASSRRSIALRTATAPTRRWLTISSTRVRRTATSANSAATKNAFNKTNTGTASRPSTLVTNSVFTFA